LFAWQQGHFFFQLELTLLLDFGKLSNKRLVVCHAELVEASGVGKRKILRFAQNDKE
jgi:hypothetical protein